MDSGSRARIDKVLECFEASQILLVEWETRLLRHLGVPLASNWDLIFLVPDEQLPKACNIAATHGLRAADRKTLPPGYPSEFADLGFRYIISGSADEFWLLCRLVLLPISWTGIQPCELVPISVPDPCQPTLPCTLWTVPLPAVCAAFVRMVTRERRGSQLRSRLIADLTNIIAYSLFDMSYEGDYMEFPPNDQPLTDDEIAEIEKAVDEIKGWDFRKDDEWIRDALVSRVSGKASYEELPFKET